MIMTPEEICREYRLAKNKANQVTVLADQNQCSRIQILNILEVFGEKVDKRLYGRRKVKEENPMKEVKTTVPVSAPKESGVTLTKDEAAVLGEYLESSLCQHIVNNLASTEPRECLLKMYELTSIYKKLL